MPTMPNSPASQNEESRTSEILVQKGLLNEMGVDPDKLVILFLSATEMVIGEDLDYQGGPDDSYQNYLLADVVLLKNPKRLTRLQMIDRNTGGLAVEIRFSDFDFLSGGKIEVRHQGGFRLSWLNGESQLTYLKIYVGFLDSRRVAKAKAAGLVIPGLST